MKHKEGIILFYILQEWKEKNLKCIQHNPESEDLIKEAIQKTLSRDSSTGKYQIE